MSPAAALRSEVVHFYAPMIFGLLLVAGVVLAARRNRAGAAWQAYRGWLFIVPVMAAALFLGRETTILFFTGVAVLGFREFAQATALDVDRYLTGAVYVGILVAGAAA